MINLSSNELKRIAKSRSVKDYKNKSKEYLNKKKKQKQKLSLFKKKIEEIKKDFSELRQFSKSKTNEFIKCIYDIKIKKSFCTKNKRPKKFL